MEVWKSLEILKRPKKNWFFSRADTEEKLNALENIADKGSPHLIQYLTDFLKDENKKIRDKSLTVIVLFFEKLTGKKQHYETLKYCDISESDMDFYKTHFSPEQYAEILIICSFNHNGYVREKAVKELTRLENPKILRFLIYRLADWVLPVRQVALKGIEHYKSGNHIDDLINNLPFFEWLQKVERADLSDVYQDIIGFIISTNKEHVISGWEKYSDKPRLILAKHISDSLAVSPVELRILFSDKHFLIRNLTLKHFNLLKPDEIDQLLNDKSSKIRLQTLYHLQGRKGFQDIIKNYLADSAIAIRHLARFSLKQSDINLGDFYNKNLIDGIQIIGSLCGLAEVNAKQHSQTVETYLNHSKAKIRKAAFLTLKKFDEENTYRFALINLDNPLNGFRRVIIDFLAINAKPETLEKARSIYKVGNYDQKKIMLQLFSKIGGWAVLPDLIIGTIDENESIRSAGKKHIESWKIEAVKLYTSPKTDDLIRAKEILKLSNSIHEAKQYFSKNPLDGLDFYLD